MDFKVVSVIASSFLELHQTITPEGAHALITSKLLDITNATYSYIYDTPKRKCQSFSVNIFVMVEITFPVSSNFSILRINSSRNLTELISRQNGTLCNS